MVVLLSQKSSPVRDAKMLGSTVVLSDTVGAATEQEVKDWASIVYDEDLTSGSAFAPQRLRRTGYQTR